MNLTDQAKEIINNDTGYINNNNFKIIKVEENYCEIVGQLTESSLNPYNTAHGGYIFGLADTAAGIAAMTNGKKAVTINSTIDYINPGIGNSLRAIAKSIKTTNSLAFIEVVIYDETDNLVAKSTINYYYMNK